MLWFHNNQTYNIIDWQTLFTWLWRWLPLRLSKRQSPTTVLFRTTLTRTITLYELIIMMMMMMIIINKCMVIDQAWRTGGRGRLQAKHWLNHHCQCDVTFRLDEIQNGAQWVKYKKLIKMRNFAPIFCPIFLGSLKCGLYYIEESLFGTFWWPKYSKGR